MLKLCLSNNKIIVACEPNSDKRMDGQLNGNIFRCSDGHKYYKLKSDMSWTKWYLERNKYGAECRVVIHTNYTNKAVDHLRVLHQISAQNHVPTRGSVMCEQSLSNINNNTNKVSPILDKYPSGGGRKSVAKKEDVNTSCKAQVIFTPL